MFRVAELVARGLIDGHSAGARGGVCFLAGVEGAGSDFHSGSKGGSYRR